MLWRQRPFALYLDPGADPLHPGPFGVRRKLLTLIAVHDLRWMEAAERLVWWSDTEAGPEQCLLPMMDHRRMHTVLCGTCVTVSSPFTVSSANGT